jgi:hypothetical protein
MAWTWRFEKADGTETAPAVEPDEFTTQGDAESWIGEVWKELAAGGTDQVHLFDDGTKVYGPMSLHPEPAPTTPEPTATDDAVDEPGAVAPDPDATLPGPGDPADLS